MTVRDKPDKSWTVDNATSASAPGRIQLSYLRWLRHKPFWPATWAVALPGAIALAWFVHWGFWIGAMVLLLCNLFYWLRVREHFHHGDVNPGLVVSVHPLLIAVSADMTKGIGKFPVIKIVRARLARIVGKTPKLGSRAVTVALYTASTDRAKPYWEDIIPFPAEYATADLKVIESLLAKFSAQDWQRLEAGLKEVPKPYRPGLYFMGEQGVLAEDAEDAEEQHMWVETDLDDYRHEVDRAALERIFARKGFRKFITLSADELDFVIAEQVKKDGGPTDRTLYQVEYFQDDQRWAIDKPLPVAEVRALFLRYLDGDSSWRKKYRWEKREL